MTILRDDEPPVVLGDPRELLLENLAYYRNVVLRKVEGLSDEQLNASNLPSGWTPLQLVTHLAHVERRWIRWGFLGEEVDAPWGDHGPDDRWAATRPLEEVTKFWLAEAELTREVVAGRALDTVAAVGGRFPESEPVPTLGWILFHLLQEFARHAGQLDVVRELTDGALGE